MSDVLTIKEFDPHDMPLSCTWVVIGVPGSGKCNRRDTPVLMANGEIKPIQDIKVGDQVMGDDSSPRNVTRLFSGRDMLYKYEANDGSCEPYYFTGKHTLALKYNEGIRLCDNKGRYRVRFPSQDVDISKGYPLLVPKMNDKSFRKTLPNANEQAEQMKEALLSSEKITPIYEIEVEDYINLSKSKRHHCMAYRTGVEFNNGKVKLDIDPYFLGLWLGDGTSGNTDITNIDDEIIDFVKDYADYLGMRYVCRRNGYVHSIVRPDTKAKNSLLDLLRGHNLIKNKHIPHIFKTASRDDRLILLAGLIDTDGSLANNMYYEITQKNKQLADDIVFLARSLGFYASKTECVKWCMHKGTRREGVYQRMNICSTPEAHISEIPVLIARKVPKPMKDGTFAENRKNMLHYRFTITPDKVDTYYGIETDGNHRYLLGDFTVTRNCLGEDTPVMMYDGSIKKVQHIVEGDKLMGDDLQPRDVLRLGRGEDDLYRVSYDHPDYVNNSYVVNKDHILTLKRNSNSQDLFLMDRDGDTPLSKDKEPIDIPIEEYLRRKTLREALLNSQLGYGGFFIDPSTGKATDAIPLHIEYIGRGPYYGFTITGNGRFLLGDGTVTHNTTFMENMAYHLKHRYPVARVFVGTEANYKDFCRIFHPLYVSSYWDEEEERSHIKRQKTCVMENGRNYPGNYAINIIDDCSDDPKLYKTKVMKGLFKLGSQHWAQLLMIGLQYAIDMPVDIRKSVSYVALGREPEKKERVKLYENFGGIAGSLEMFEALMDQITGDYTFLIFKKRSQSNNLEDCVFWYRTKKLKKWKFGCKEYREWADSRYDKDYVEEIDY